MGRGVARVGLDHAGGVQLGGGQNWGSVDGGALVVRGDRVAPHGQSPHSPAPIMVGGDGWFTLDGVPVMAEGDLASCGHATTGSDWWQIP
jgi:uncharacterized Zn-binding protein involved in type VI secretion